MLVAAFSAHNTGLTTLPCLLPANTLPPQDTFPATLACPQWLPPLMSRGESSASQPSNADDDMQTECHRVITKRAT